MTFKLQTTFPIKFPFFTRCCFRCISRFILLEWLLSVVEAAGNAESADILAGRSLKALPALNLWGCVGLCCWASARATAVFKTLLLLESATPGNPARAGKPWGFSTTHPSQGLCLGGDGCAGKHQTCPRIAFQKDIRIEPGYFLMDLLFICFMLLAG